MIDRLHGYWRPLVGLLALAAIGGFLILRPAAGTAQPSAISAEASVYLAVDAVQAASPIGARLAGTPTSIRGKLMTYCEAAQIRYGEPLKPSEGLWQWRDRPVWLVAIRGDSEVIDNVAGATPRLVKETQWLVVLDAETGDYLGSSYRGPDSVADTSLLPALGMPSGPFSLPPTLAPSLRPPAPTAAPTRPAAPMPPTR